MPVVFDDWIKNPISIINNIFESDPVDFEAKIQEFFENKLKSEKDYLSIPCLNEVPLHEISPNSLVRYRCMIQDTFDPVYYTSVQKLVNKTTEETCLMTLKYKEQLDVPEGFEIVRQNESNNCDLHQRTTIYCVPIPGEAEWVKDYFREESKQHFTSKNPTASTSSNMARPSKRVMDQDQEDQIVDITQNLKLTASNETHVICKDENTDIIKCKICLKTKITRPNESKSEEKTKTICFTKKTKTEDLEEKDYVSKNNSNLVHNFPLCSQETGSACLVKIYDNFDGYKINDMVEFIGIFSQDPSLAFMFDEHKDYLELEHDEKMTEFKLHKEDKIETEDHACKCSEMDIYITKTHEHTKKLVLSEYPPSLVPRIHCVKSFSILSNNPLIKRFKLNEADCGNIWEAEFNEFLKSILKQTNISVPVQEANLFETGEIYLNKLRNDIVSSFQEILLGDALAAEYLLMNLLSSVFMRRDVTVLGKFTLNITNIPKTKKVCEEEKENMYNYKPFSECFYSVLKNLIPISYMYKLTVDSLNNSNLIPNKDYNKDKLISGMLQLPNKFNLIIDETGLKTGELKQKGLMNLNSLKEIIQWQKLNYDFSFHQQEFNTDLRLVVLSESKSLLPFDVSLKLDHKITEFDSEIYQTMCEKLFDQNMLINLRKYFSILSNLEYKLTDSMQKIVENDIVQIRQTYSKENSKLSFEDFHLMLVVARLQTISYGKKELGMAEWNRAKSLEFERLKTRI